MYIEVATGSLDWALAHMRKGDKMRNYKWKAKNVYWELRDGRIYEISLTKDGSVESNFTCHAIYDNYDWEVFNNE